MTTDDTIAAFLPSLQPLLADASITEIMITEGGAKAYIERQGIVTPVHGWYTSPHNLILAIQGIGRDCGEDVSSRRPLLDARLYDGARITARIAGALPPCAVGGAALTIRRFGQRFSLAQLVDRKMLTEHDAGLLVSAVLNSKNILIAGGCGTGKTTLLTALLETMPEEDRILLIEETAEIQAVRPNMVKLEAQQKLDGDSYEIGIAEVTQRMLLRHALRHRPDRIILGEVRGAEAYDLLQSLNSGHSGSLCTIHANSAVKALARLADCALEANVGWTEATVMNRVENAIDVVAFVERVNGIRTVTEIVNITGERL